MLPLIQKAFTGLDQNITAQCVTVQSRHATNFLIGDWCTKRMTHGHEHIFKIIKLQSMYAITCIQVEAISII